MEQPAMLTCKQRMTRFRGKATLILPKAIAVAGGVIAALLVACVWSIGVTQAQEGERQLCGEPVALPVQPEQAGRYRFQQIAGPYDIRVDLIPSRLSLGTTVLAVYVWEASTCQPVPDAMVTLSTRHRDADEEKKVNANHIPEEPGRYHAQMTLDAAGDWQVTIVIVDDDLGTAAVEVPTLTVAEARVDIGGRFVFIAVSLIIIAGAAYLWWSTQRRRRRLGAAGLPGDGSGPDDDPASGAGP